MRKLYEMTKRIEQHQVSFDDYTKRELPHLSENLQFKIIDENFGKLEQMQPDYDKAMARMDTFEKIAPQMANIIKEMEKVAQFLDQENENGRYLKEYQKRKNENNELKKKDSGF